MNDSKLLSRIKSLIVRLAKEDIISLYVIGSFTRGEMERHSDIDLVAVMKPSFDFERERQINEILNSKIRTAHRIDMGTIGYEEFFGGKRRGSITRHISVPVFLRFLRKARLVYGKRIDLDRLPIKPAGIKEELRYQIELYDSCKKDFRNKYRLSPDFTFKDFVKIMFYIADIELQMNGSKC
jgi:predicted nucleotidyltransferase